MNIESVSKEFVTKLLDGAEYYPFGRYIMFDEADGKPVWVAIDNSDGNAWTEEFEQEKDAIGYLLGYYVRNRFGEMLNQ